MVTKIWKYKIYSISENNGIADVNENKKKISDEAIKK